MLLEQMFARNFVGGGVVAKLLTALLAIQLHQQGRQGDCNIYDSSLLEMERSRGSKTCAGKKKRIIFKEASTPTVS
jgi:hypothetical protein